MARIAFLLDEHIPSAVAQALRQRQIDVRTANEAGLLNAPDTDYSARAHAEMRVLVTQASDFLRLHAQQEPHAGIVYCEQGSRTIGQLVAGLVLIHEALEQSEMVGRVEFL